MRSRLLSRNKRIIREKLLKRDGNRCCYCGGAMELRTFSPGEHPTPESVTIEHVVPFAQGGSNRLHNLKLAHRQCNMARALGMEP